MYQNAPPQYNNQGGYPQQQQQQQYGGNPGYYDQQQMNGAPNNQYNNTQPSPVNAAYQRANAAMTRGPSPSPNIGGSPLTGGNNTGGGSSAASGLIRLTLRKPMGIVFEPMTDPHNPSQQRGYGRFMLVHLMIYNYLWLLLLIRNGCRGCHTNIITTL